MADGEYLSGREVPEWPTDERGRAKTFEELLAAAAQETSTAREVAEIRATVGPQH